MRFRELLDPLLHEHLFELRQVHLFGNLGEHFRGGPFIDAALEGSATLGGRDIGLRRIRLDVTPREGRFWKSEGGHDQPKE